MKFHRAKKKGNKGVNILPKNLQFSLPLQNATVLRRKAGDVLG